MINTASFQRTWILYAGFLILVLLSPNVGEMIKNAEWETLSRLTPNTDYIEEFIYKKEGFDAEKLKSCLYYHKKIIAFSPKQSADAYAILGFCYELLGEHQQAVKSYERSIEFNSSFFWTFYNLGVIYYNQKDFERAVLSFKAAAEQDPVVTSMILMTSKVYLDIYASDASKNYNVNMNLRDGYHKALIFQVLCLQQLGNYRYMYAVALRAAQIDQWKDPLFFFYAGVAACNLKLYDEAIKLLHEYVRYNTVSAEAFHYIGLSMQGMGQEAMAQEFFKKSKELEERFGPTLPDYTQPRVQFF